MKMNPYPAYKPTGLPWLPQIPVHWETLRIKYAFKERCQKGYPEEPLLAATQNHGVIPKKLYETRTVTAQKDLHLLKLVKVGDFVISLRSFQGGIEYAYYQGIISPAYTVMIPYASCLQPMFFKYLAKSKPFVKLLQTCVTGIREGQNIDYEALRRNAIPIPTPDEQRQIVRYLDAMTAKINKLIRVKKKQIALLQEQKQAIINQAVTKGLNPNAEMKDSGIDWLGKIPKHWGKDKILRLFKLIGSGTTPPNSDSGAYEHGKVPWINSGDLYACNKVIQNIQKKVSLSAIEKYNALKIFPANTIVIAMYGASIGNLGISPVSACCNQACCCLALPKRDLLLDFARHVLQSCKFYWLEKSNGGSQPNISQEIVKQTWVTLPPVAEQAEIVSFLEQEEQKIEMLVLQHKRDVDLFNEYKNSLISSVVTGQADVRNIPVDDFNPADLVAEPEDDAEEENSAEKNEE